MGEANSPSVVHVGYDISPLSRVKFKILLKDFQLNYLTFPNSRGKQLVRETNI
jgi:hypothetical protein